MALARVDPKEQLIVIGEKLFSREGIDGVPMRKIGVAAGNLNNSAVQYHFGTKDRLVQAINAYRQADLHRRRGELMQLYPPHEVRGWLECQVRVVMEQADAPDSHYLGFVAALQYYRDRRGTYAAVPRKLRREVESFHALLLPMLTHLDAPLRAHRASRAQIFIVNAGADRERARDAGLPLFPLETEIADLVDGMVGFLTAPASATTLTFAKAQRAASAPFLL